MWLRVDYVPTYIRTLVFLLTYCFFLALQFINRFPVLAGPLAFRPTGVLLLNSGWWRKCGTNQIPPFCLQLLAYISESVFPKVTTVSNFQPAPPPSPLVWSCPPPSTRLLQNFAPITFFSFIRKQRGGSRIFFQKFRPWIAPTPWLLRSGRLCFGIGMRMLLFARLKCPNHFVSGYNFLIFFVSDTLMCFSISDIPNRWNSDECCPGCFPRGLAC